MVVIRANKSKLNIMNAFNSNDLNIITNDIEKATKSYLRNGRFEKFNDLWDMLVLDNESRYSAETVNVYGTAMRNTMKRVVNAHNDAVAKAKKEAAESKTIGGMFPELAKLRGVA
jgi:hypothetical protein